jgi:asparagine synthase (glutamine-hydrolysing)
MCGLAGYINLKQSLFSVDEPLLCAMRERLTHRGPNGFRTWINQERQIGLVHSRLSIVDLSDAGFQPMFDTDRQIAVCCNGEIYNHRALRAELELFGHRFSSHSDTEVIVYAYKQWGIACLDRFEGMFAIVIVDMRTDELYLVRDRMGVKPLYFSTHGGILSFASEIKALWVLPWMQQSINTTALSHYLTFLVTPAPMTLYKGVYKLPAAFYLKVAADRSLSFHEWYSPIKKSEYTREQLNDEQFCVERIRALLRESVQKRLMSDVPFGVFLSGGIDSSLNVALMSEYTDRVKTFNVSFSDGPEYAEVEWARKVARHFNTEHHEVVISEKEAFDFFNKMVYHQDEPIADSVCIPLYYVSKLLKDSGVTVVHVGEGSDELFCGYSTYAQYLDIHRRYWQPAQNYVPTIVKKGMYRAATTLFGAHRGRVTLMKNWVDGKHLFWSGAMAFSELLKKDVMAQDMQTNQPEYDPIVEQIYAGFNQAYDSYAVVDYHLAQLKMRDGDHDFFKAMVYLEFKHRLSELLLMRVDKMTMATSVEGRVPFLDHKLVEFTLQIPTHLKYKNGTTKYILKKACEGVLPHDVIYRKKMGFAAPTARWFRSGEYFRHAFKQTLQSQQDVWSMYINYRPIQDMVRKHEAGQMDYSVQLWVLQNLMMGKVHEA